MAIEIQDFTTYDFPSEIYENIAFSKKHGVIWTREDAFKWYNEELSEIEKNYKSLQNKIVGPHVIEDVKRIFQYKPGPLPLYKTRMYNRQ